MLLADQDRSRWNAAQIADGRRALERALALHGRGPYVLQAAIASLHADEPRDWAEIVALYGELAPLTGSPVVELNRAVAVAEVEGPAAALAIVDGLDLDGYRYLHSTRGRAPARGSDAPTRRAPRTGARSRSRAPSPSGASSSARARRALAKIGGLMVDRIREFRRSACSSRRRAQRRASSTASHS